jgi:prepilin-type N-terminal cleavage/methylation domain-containing protein
MNLRPANNRPVALRAFTMVEVAISLAIIGVALVAIIGVLPIGMNTQRDNREETTVNQDATVLLEAIRNGSQGADDLTNYVYAIVNDGDNPGGTFTNTSLLGNQQGYFPGAPVRLLSGQRIIGLLSTPEFVNSNGVPSINWAYSNHIVAYVRSLSGVAAEKPPQTNDIMVADSFSYRVLCVNAPVPVAGNYFSLPAEQQKYLQQLFVNQHELRMTFLWPQLPNGKVGSGRLTFRATIAGQTIITNDSGRKLYFYQSQSFTNAP